MQLKSGYSFPVIRNGLTYNYPRLEKDMAAVWIVQAVLSPERFFAQGLGGNGIIFSFILAGVRSQHKTKYAQRSRELFF